MIWATLFWRDCVTEIQRYPLPICTICMYMYMYGGMKVGQQLGHVFRLYSNTTRAGLGTRLLARPGPVSCVWAAQDVPLCRPMGTTGTLAWPAPPGAPGQSGP